ncbi:cytochrome P450 CYP72A219-like [Salvia hispanica]|uniref:cytochrome P450 CYP72A219-like n=1 Tax=Salvia hispanica TaxID=49212 RepID=UPI0020090C3B|nr:cytochrome P450 CYP72A219-like [Salvia hispanica]
MSPLSISLIVILCLLIASMVIWGWKMLNWVWIRPKKIEKRLRAQGLAGNSYRLLYGDTNDMAAMIKEAKSKPIKLSDDIVPRVLPLHHHIINKYGKASFIWVGPVARVLIMEPELLKKILINNHIFKKPTHNPLAQFLVCGLAGYEDEKWAKHRRIINPAFYVEKLKHMVPAMHTSCDEMIRKWEKLVVDEVGFIEIEVQSHFEDLTTEIISRTAFGSRHEEGRRIFELQKEQSELTRQVLQSVYIPGWRYIPTKRNRRMKEINSQLCRQLRGIINKREESMGKGECADDDLLGILLKSNEREIRENDGSSSAGMSIEEVVEECKTFYLSGQESTSNLLSWTMMLLGAHPTWQEQARDEVFRVFGDGEPHFDGLNRLKVLTMILHEVLRLYPPAIIFNRILENETELGNMTLPGGVHVLLPIILIHRDKHLWGEDADEFKPERFSEGIAKATQNQLSFFPFSWGPRVCIGNNFALIEAKMALAMILRRFSFKLSPAYTHAPSFVVSLQPQHGIHLTLRRLHK